MLGKLIKYEYKATSRTFIPIYIALLLVAVINRVFRMGNIDVAWGISTLALVGLFIALGVLTIIVIVQRFNKNLLGDEGYLMFTLPVKSEQLIVSKVIISILWTIISGIVAFATFLILLGDAPLFNEVFSNWNLIWAEFTIAVQEQMNVSGPILFIVMIVVILLLSYISFIFEIYLSLAAAQLPAFNKNRGVIGFAAFFVINVVLSICSQIVELIIPEQVVNNFSSAAIVMIITTLIVCIILFIGIKWILDKHLNLE